MPAPVLQALLVADQIYQDQSTGKFVICGIFGTIFYHPSEVPKPAPNPHEEAGGGQPTGGSSANLRGKSEPAGGTPSGPAGTPEPLQQLPIHRLIRAGSPYAYVSLTEVHGQKIFQLRYVDLHENSELFATQFGVECRDPLETIQISIPLPTLPVPHEGVFALELLCEGELLGTHRVRTKRQPGA